MLCEGEKTIELLYALLRRLWTVVESSNWMMTAHTQDVQRDGLEWSSSIVRDDAWREGREKLGLEKTTILKGVSV